MDPARDWTFPSCFLSSHRLESWAERRKAGKGFLLGIGDLDLDSDFCHFPCQFRAGSCEVAAVDPQDVCLHLPSLRCYAAPLGEHPGRALVDRLG
jgi:hypothetical protein